MSKLAAAPWAKKALDPQWADLIQRALDDRPDPSFKVTQPADPHDRARTVEFLSYALDEIR